RPYAYLDDAPLEERRTQAVMSRRWLAPEAASDIGRLDPEAIARVRGEAWPDPVNADELHDALVWLGFLDVAEAQPGWCDWFLEPTQSSAALTALETEGFAMRGRFTPGAETEEWCERRLLARIHRYTVGRLLAEIQPVAARDFLRFLLGWHRVTADTRMEGPDALEVLVRQLEGFEAPAGAWETEI